MNYEYHDKLKFLKLEFPINGRSLHISETEFEYHEKLEFLKLKFPISGRFLHILKIVVDCKIFSKTVIFGYFGHKPFYKHSHWWRHKFSNMAPQKTSLSILSSHFIIHTTSMDLYFYLFD